MKIKMSRVKMAFFIIAVMLTNIPIMADGVIIPISNNLYQAFPNHTGAVNFIVSGPQLIIAVASIIAGPLMNKISKKRILVVSGAVCTAGLSLGVVIQNVWYVLICRSIAGFATGFINVAAVALIAEVFTEEGKRSWMMGIYNAVMAGIGTLMSVIAGILAVSGWQNAYKVFWSCIPMVLCFIFFLPEIKEETSEKNALQGEGDAKKGMGFEFVMMLVSLFIFYVANMGISYFVSVYVAENTLGNEAFAGTAASLTTVGSFFCCLAFGYLYNKLKRYVIFISYILFAAAVALLLLGRSPIITVIAMLLLGGSYGSAFSYSYAHAPSLVEESKVDQSISVCTAVYAIGCFLATYFTTFSMNHFSVKGTFTGILPVMMGLSILVLVIEGISVVISRKRNQKRG
jgi:MFS family permease